MPYSRPATLWRLFGFLGVSAGSALVAACATASSPDAWEIFRQQIAEQCVAASNLTDAEVRIDPFGTDSYGVASVTGLAEDGSERTVICVAQKSPDEIVDVEVSADLDEWVAPPN